MEIDRRSFLKVLGGGIAGVAAGNMLTPRPLKADEVVSPKEFVGVLVDTTRCVGCRSCEAACAEAHHLSVPDISDESAFEKRRQTTEGQWTVVNRYKTEKGEIFVKTQCMHCNQPGCVAACLVKAMEKRKEGPVPGKPIVWRCFYMTSCPFEIPSLNIRVPPPGSRSAICAGKGSERGRSSLCGELPGASTSLWKQKGMIEEANRRIYQKPGEYLTHIYGEHEVGGTGYLYLLKGSVRTDWFQDRSGYHSVSGVHERFSLFRSPRPSALARVLDGSEHRHQKG